MIVIRDYFWPKPPKQISAESQAAMQGDLRGKGVWSAELDDKHRRAVNVWTRHSDNLVRAENRQWLHKHGVKFVRRWATVSCIAWAGAWAASGTLWLEVPLVLIGFVAGVLAMLFQYLRYIE